MTIGTMAPRFARRRFAVTGLGATLAVMGIVAAAVVQLGAGTKPLSEGRSVQAGPTTFNVGTTR